jgi:two-component system, cell cycle sensor histidine kinase and response regulator CckA
MSSRRVLLMDDEEAIREIAGTMLRFLGYQVEACTNGGDAVELYRQAKEQGTPFGVAILDLTVEGGMGGIDAAKEVLQLDPEANLVVSSGYSDDCPTWQRLFKLSLPKPYRLADLERVMEAL